MSTTSFFSLEMVTSVFLLKPSSVATACSLLSYLPSRPIPSSVQTTCGGRLMSSSICLISVRPSRGRKIRHLVAANFSTERMGESRDVQEPTSNCNLCVWCSIRCVRQRRSAVSYHQRQRTGSPLDIHLHGCISGGDNH